MVDSTDLIVIASVAQTVVITLTLVVFIFQFRSQEKAIKESAYQAVQGRYTDYIRMLVEKPELTRLLQAGFGQPTEQRSPVMMDGLSPEDTRPNRLHPARLRHIRGGLPSPQEEVDRRRHVDTVG